MADNEWIDVSPSQDKSSDWVDIPSAADSNNGAVKFGADHPYLKAIGDTASQAFINPFVQVANELAPAVSGFEKGIGINPTQDKRPLSGPDMTNAPMAAKVLGDVAGGFGKGAAATFAGAGNPFLGYGFLKSLEAYGKGEPVMPAFISGASEAVPQTIAGAAGGKLASMATKGLSDSLNPFAKAVSKYAPNVGTAAGMGGAAAAQASSSGGNPLRAAATGTTFGLMSPMGGVKEATQEQYDAQLSKHAEILRKVVNPTQGEINRITNNGNNLDEAFKVGAQNGLILDKDVNGKLDTSGAMEQLGEVVGSKSDELSKALSSQPSQRFDLRQIATKAKENFKKNAPTAKDAQAGSSHIDDYINAEINELGGNFVVDGPTLNKIKQGMWKTSYDNNAPNSQDAARSIGYAAKNAIQDTYKDQNVQQINSQLGDMATLNNILNKAQGRVVQGGKLGTYFAKTLGGIVGSGIGENIPVLGKVAGPIAGWGAGGKISEILNDPKRITEGLASKLQGMNVSKTTPDIVAPKSMNPFEPDVQRFEGEGGFVPPSQGSSNPFEMLPNTEKNFAKSSGSLNPFESQSKKLGAIALTGGLAAGLASKADASQKFDMKGIAKNFNNSIDMTKYFEGFKPVVYEDTSKSKHKTIGYGFNIDEPSVRSLIPQDVLSGSRELTKPEANQIFKQIYPQAIKDAQNFIGKDMYGRLSNNRKAILVDMAYNLGGAKLNGFDKMRTALLKQDYKEAANQMVDSDWYGQVGDRSKFLVNLMLQGK